MGKSRKKSRTHKKVEEGENPNAAKVPKTFVMRSGEVGHSVMGLVGDIRRLMEPNTATKLRVRKTKRRDEAINISCRVYIIVFFSFCTVSLTIDPDLHLYHVPSPRLFDNTK